MTVVVKPADVSRFMELAAGENLEATVLAKVTEEPRLVMRQGRVLAAYTPGYGGVAEAVLKMCLGNGLGFKYNEAVSMEDIFGYNYGAFVLELSDNTEVGTLLGETCECGAVCRGDASVSMDKLISAYEDKLESVYPCNIPAEGKKIDTDESCPTLSFNTIARHQSKIVRVRVASNMSPWLAETKVGDVYSVPISHGEGRLLADEKLLREFALKGQVATQYVDADGLATDEIQFNPNNSVLAIEGMTSPDGRVFGKMGHAERIGADLYKNVPGNYDMKMFVSAVKYFK